ncbi:TPA: hypothetical protein ACPWGP_002595 [Pseudomonas aeruginosa]
MKQLGQFLSVVYMSFGASFASAATLNSGYVGCVTEEYLDQFIQALVAKDDRGMEYLMNSYKCIHMKGGLEVSVLDRGFTVSKIRVYVGGDAVELWTPNEAIKR